MYVGIKPFVIEVNVCSLNLNVCSLNLNVFLIVRAYVCMCTSFVVLSVCLPVHLSLCFPTTLMF